MIRRFMLEVDGSPDTSRRRHLWMLGSIVVWAAVARVESLAGPFGYGWQHLGATYATIARNYQRYGPLATRFAMVRNPDVAPPEAWIYFTHHPPGMGLSTAAVASVLGGALAVKLPGLLFSLLQVVVTYALVAQTISTRAGLAAAFATAVMPAGAYFATHGSDLGPQSISLALLTLLADERARRRAPDRPRSTGALAAAAAALFFDWPALVICGFVALRDALARHWRRALLFALVVPTAIGAQWLHVRWATQGVRGGGSLVDSFVDHGPIGAASLLSDLDASRVAERLVGHLRFLFGDAGLVVAGLGVVLGLFGARRTSRTNPMRARRVWGLALALTALALLYSVPFARAVLVHRFWLIVALPGVAAACGVAVHLTGRSRAARVAWLVAAVAFGVASTMRDVRLQRADRTPYYEELGDVLRSRVPSGQAVFTNGHESETLAYYAERTVHADVGDATIAEVSDGDVELPSSGFVAIATPAVDPSAVTCERLVRLLEQRGTPQRVELPRSRSTLLLFELARLQSKASPNESVR